MNKSASSEYVGGGWDGAQEAVDEQQEDEELAVRADARPLVAHAGDERLEAAELQRKRTMLNLNLVSCAAAGMAYFAEHVLVLYNAECAGIRWSRARVR